MKKLVLIILIHGNNKKNENLKKFFFFKKNIKKRIKFCSINNKNKIIKTIKKLLKKKFNTYLIIPLFIIKGKHVKIDLKKIFLFFIKINKKIKIFYLKILTKQKIFKKFLKILIKKKLKNFYKKIF